ncbi:MAG: lysophospholipid acyltransferase family protein [Acidobacteriota bacterium]
MGAPIRRRLRATVTGPLLRLARWGFGVLPWTAAQHLGARIGGLAWHVARRDRQRAIEHLVVAFPDRSDDERRGLARASFRHLGTAIGELLHIWGRPAAAADRHVEVVGFDEIEANRAGGRPIVLLTGHCGNWELISCANHSHGLGLAAIARELGGGLQGVAEDLRGHLGSETIARGSRSSSRQMLRTLRSGGVLCLLIDQDIRTDGVWVPFFGRLAHTPTAAADIALRLGASVVPCFAERLDSGRHRVTFHPALDLPAADAPDATREATALMTAAIEAQIRRCPEQWVWMHRRWRRRPPEEVS